MGFLFTLPPVNFKQTRLPARKSTKLRCNPSEFLSLKQKDPWWGNSTICLFLPQGNSMLLLSLENPLIFSITPVEIPYPHLNPPFSICFFLNSPSLAKLSHCSCKRNKKYWPINKPKRRHNKQLTSSTSSKEDTIATGMWKKMAAKKKLDNLILLVLFPVSLGIFMPYQFYPLNKIGKMMIKLLGYIWETLCNSKELTDRNFGHKLKA